MTPSGGGAWDRAHDGGGEGMASEQRGKGGEVVLGAVYKPSGERRSRGGARPVGSPAAKQQPINSHNSRDSRGIYGRNNVDGMGSNPPLPRPNSVKRSAVGGESAPPPPPNPPPE